VGSLVALLVGQAVRDTGARISLHMSPKDHQILIAVLSHQPDRSPADETTVREIAAHRAVDSCGTDTSDEGPSVWAVVDLTPPRCLPAQADPRGELPGTTMA
jgi:hypothetical protein